MSTVIFSIIFLLYMVSWGRALYRLYKNIHTSEVFTPEEKVILTRQVIALSPAVIAFILLIGALFYPHILFFDSGVFFSVILLILLPTLSYIGITAIKYRVALSREPIRGKGAIFIGTIAIGGVILQAVIVFFINFF